MNYEVILQQTLHFTSSGKRLLLLILATVFAFGLLLLVRRLIYGYIFELSFLGELDNLLEAALVEGTSSEVPSIFDCLTGEFYNLCSISKILAS